MVTITKLYFLKSRFWFLKVFNNKKKTENVTDVADNSTVANLLKFDLLPST